MSTGHRRGRDTAVLPRGSSGTSRQHEPQCDEQGGTDVPAMELGVGDGLLGKVQLCDGSTYVLMSRANSALPSSNGKQVGMPF